MILLASAWPDWINAVGTAVTAAFAAFAVVQLWEIRKQTRQSALANVSESYGQVSATMDSLRDILFKHPDWRPYFYEGHDPEKHKRGLRNWRAKPSINELNLVCDQIVDLADSIVEQRHTVPAADVDWSTWESYLRFIYQNSPLLKRYLRENREFYPDYVLTLFGYIIVRDEHSGTVRSEWSVDEWRPDGTEGQDQEEVDAALERCIRATGSSPRNGYPWFKTWVMTGMRKEPGDDQGPRLVAVVRPGESERPKGEIDPETADVRFAWCDYADGGHLENEKEPEDVKEEKRVLCSWVLEVLRASSLLRNANVRFAPQTEPQVVRLKHPRWVLWLKRLRGVPRRERYLAPTYPELKRLPG
jgi:hypothetical protein